MYSIEKTVPYVFTAIKEPRLYENNVQVNTTKVRANLRNGVTEFLEGQ